MISDKRLIIFPYAGGNGYAFRDMARHLKNDFFVTALDLPGHGSRMRESLLTDVYAMADDLFEQVRPFLNSSRVIFWGHSLGSILAYFVARLAGKANLPGPCRLFLSGRPAPFVNVHEKYLHLMPRQAFLSHLLSYGGIPDSVVRETELIDFFLPIIRADFQALSTFDEQNLESIHVPLTILMGTEDRPKIDGPVRSWQELSTQEVSFKSFSGGHFFIFQHLAAIGWLISQSIR